MNTARWSASSPSTTSSRPCWAACPRRNGEDEEPRSVRRADGSWLLDGRFPLDEFRDLFDLADLPEGDFHTLAGLVVTQLGHIPRIAESFECLGLHFEVVDMDANRVDRVLVRPASGCRTRSRERGRARRPSADRGRCAAPAGPP